MKDTTTRVKRILILEMSAKGHHPSYIRWLLESGISEFAHLTIAAPRALLQHKELIESPVSAELAEIVVTPADEVRLADFSTLGLVRREFTVRRLYSEAYRRVSEQGHIDLVILPFLDDCANAFAVCGAPFGSTPWMAINMRVQFHLSKMGVIAPEPKARGLREWLFRRLLRQPELARMFAIDPTLAEYAQSDRRGHFRKLEFLPDPSVTFDLPLREVARKALGISEDAIVVLAYGALGVRKGIVSLMSAMQEPSCPTNIHLLLAGIQEQPVTDFIAGQVGQALRQSGRLHVLPGYVPEERVPQLLSASDAMWIGYINFYTMSSVLVLAARHGLLPIVSERGVSGYLIRQRPCGLQVDATSTASILSVLRRLARRDASTEAMAAKGPALFAIHTVAEFQRTIREAVPAAMALKSP